MPASVSGKPQKTTKAASSEDYGDDVDDGSLDPRLRTCLTKMDWVKPDKNAKNKVHMRVPLKIVITGVFMGITRDSIELLVEELGGKKVGSVSGLTDYLITGYKLEDGRDFT